MEVIDKLKTRSNIVSSLFEEENLSNEEVFKFLKANEKIDLILISRFFNEEKLSSEEYGLLLNIFNYIDDMSSIVEILNLLFLNSHIFDITKCCLDYEGEDEQKYITLPYKFVFEQLLKISNERGYNRITCGNNHSVGIKEEGAVITWSNNRYNQKDDNPIGKFNSAVIREDKKILTWDDNPNGRFISVCRENNHSVGIKEDGRVITWDNNICNQRDDNPIARFNSVTYKEFTLCWN